MNNFIDLEHRQSYISRYQSNSVLQSRLMGLGYFINITTEITTEIVNREEFSVYRLSEPSNELKTLLLDLEKNSPFIITKRHKNLVKKAIFLRMFYNVYTSNIKVSDFFEFIRMFNNFRYTNNLNAYDFTRLDYGEFLSENAQGFREFALAKFVKLTDIFTTEELETFGSEFLDFGYEHYSDEINGYLEAALVKAITEE